MWSRESSQAAQAAALRTSVMRRIFWQVQASETDAFTLSVYPASMPVYMELIKNGAAAKLMETGAVLKTAFCGPCFGAGDTPANNAFSIRHSTRNFPNREGSKLQSGQIASVALMDARSIAATAVNKGCLTPATDIDVNYTKPKYFFDKTIYENRVFDSKGVADPSVEIQFGPNIKDWPEMSALTENLLLKVVSEIHDPVTTTDELIPSGETSSYRSNPLGLAEFTLSRKDPAYVGRAKEVQAAEKARIRGERPCQVLPEAGRGYERCPHKVRGCRTGEYRNRQHHLCREAGRRIGQRAGCVLPEGSGRLGQCGQ